MQVALQVEEAYYGIIRSEENVQIQERSKEQADCQYEVAKARYDAGLISRKELLQAELSHQQSEVSMKRAHRQLADARHRLARLIGADDSVDFILRDTFPFEPLNINLEDAIAEATAKRFEIRKAERILERARLRGAELDHAYTAPVALKQAQMEVRRAEIQLEEVKVEIVDSIRQDWYGLKDAEYNVTATHQCEQLALDDLAITQARFDAGMVSLLDLLREQASALGAQLAASGAVWDNHLTKAWFLRSLGCQRLPPLPQKISDYLSSWNEAHK